MHAYMNLNLEVHIFTHHQAVFLVGITPKVEHAPKPAAHTTTN